MKIYTLRDIVSGLRQDSMTEYLERFQFNDVPMWDKWFNTSDVWSFVFNSDSDDREFDGSILIKGIPLEIVDMLSYIDSLEFINNNPAILNITKLGNEELIKSINERICNISSEYLSNKQIRVDSTFVYWVWNNGYFSGIYKGNIPSIIKNNVENE